MNHTTTPTPNTPDRPPAAPNPATPPRHDNVTMNCPICQHPFTPTGRQKYCSNACKATAYRRRRDTKPPTLTIPKPQPRRPITVYECDNCANRALGEQRCEDCSTFMRKIGLGGQCPNCDHPIAVTELLTQGTITTN